MEKDLHILTIRLSAFGDFLIALGRFKAIRNNNKNAKISVLTTAPFEKMAKQCGYFDEIIVDPKLKAKDLSPKKIKETIEKIKLLKSKFKKIDIIYDLQINDRTKLYYWFLFPIKKPKLVKTFPYVSDYDFSWMETDISNLNLPEKYCILITGCSKHRPLKRWESAKYGDLANKIVKKGYTPVLIGTDEDKESNDIVKALCPQSIDLTNKTKLFDLASISKFASFTVTNDTGPGLMSALCGTKTLFLLFENSNPIKINPPGKCVNNLRKEKKEDLSVDEVFTELENLNYI